MAALKRSARGLAMLGLWAALVAGSACTWSAAPPQARGGFYHTVRTGENLYRIGKRYGVPTDVLVRANGIRDVTELRVGQRLYIPRRSQQISGSSGRPRAQVPGGKERLRKRVREEARRKAKVNFAWPMKRTRLTSRFGRRNGQPHEGIDLAARQGTPIRAAESGKVIHAGRLGAYGKVVILKHAGDYRSVYAHARRLYVRKGQFVERGQKVAEVGMTGRTTGPHLHFEVRRRDVPKDPLLYLP